MQATKWDVAIYGNLILMSTSTAGWATFLFGAMAMVALVMSVIDNDK